MLAALGPRLAAEGMPAVVGMHGRITMDTAMTFLSTFFENLLHYSLIDRAMAAARAGPFGPRTTPTTQCRFCS